MLWALSSVPEMNVIKLVFKSVIWSLNCYILTRAQGLFWRTSWGETSSPEATHARKHPLTKKKKKLMKGPLRIF